MKEIFPQGEKLAKDIINFKSLKISQHAILRFYTRTNYELEKTRLELRARLKQSKLVTHHPYEKIKKHLYFQDPFDKDIIYVIRNDKKNKRDVLVTVRRPLRH